MSTLVACLRLLCQPFELVVEGCGLGSQVDLRVWEESHPGWVVRRWSCDAGRRA